MPLTLEEHNPNPGSPSSMTIYRVADLFCGAGGCSIGAQRAIRAAGAST